VGAAAWWLTSWFAVTLAAVMVTARIADPRQRHRRRTRDRADQLAALAAWTESVRDLVGAGLALPEALAATRDTAAAPITPAVQRLTDRLALQLPLSAALHAFAADLEDPAGDLVVAALLLTNTGAGRGLRDQLSALAAALRAEVDLRGTVDATRRATRRGTRIVTTVTVATVLGLRWLNPNYVEPYGTPTGQLVLTIVLGLFAAGLAWMARLAAYPTPDRFLRAPTPGGH
jgi:Flp pilus assembly protein TadB